MSSPNQSADAAEAEESSPGISLAHALAMCAIEDEDAQGFYLLNDADGRFVIDRDFGVVSLRNSEILDAERGQVFKCRIRVVEPSGASYELDMNLRLTGMVPQLVRQETMAPAAEGAPI